jgi:DDE superfamily endonuclease
VYLGDSARNRQQGQCVDAGESEFRRVRHNHVSDNLSTRGTKEVQEWLEAHPRWSFQFTPTHASWLNQIEIFFSILYRRLLKHGMFTSEQDLAEQMPAFIETYNQTASPFKWTYAGKVLEA